MNPRRWCCLLFVAGAALAVPARAAPGLHTGAGCAAGGPREAAPASLLELEPGRALLAVGRHALAEIAFDPPQAAALTGEPGPTPAVARDADRWRIAGPLRHDSACTMHLELVLALSPADALARTLAAAWREHALARSAWRHAQRERAAELAAAAARRLLAATADANEPAARADLAAQAAELGAFAIERLLEAAQAPAAGELSRAVEAAAGALPMAHPSALRVQMATARALVFAERYAEALALRRSLAAAVDATFGADSDEGLDQRLRTANLFVVTGASREAAALLDDLEPRVLRLRAPGDALRTQVRRARSAAVALRGDPRAAVDAARALRAELAAAHGDDDRRTVDADEVLARALVQAGREEDGLQRAARVLAWRRDRLGAHHAQTLHAVELIGITLGRMGRIDSATAMLAWVADEAERDGGDPRLQARARYQHAYWLNRDPGAPPQPLRMREAYRQVREAYGARSADALGAAADYAEALLRAGDTAAACALLERTHDDLQALPHGDAALRALAAGLLGRCLLQRGETADLARARALLADAWDSASAATGATSLAALPHLSALAAAHLHSGDHATAKALLQRLVTLAERQRAEHAAGSAVRDAGFGLWVAEQATRAGYRSAAWLHARDGELDAALQVADLARDRRLRDRFAEQRWRELPLAPAQRDALAQLRARRDAIDAQLALAPAIDARVALEAERAQIVQGIDGLVRGARSAPAAAPPTIARLRARLAPDEAFMMVQPAGAQWWALVVTRTRARAFVLTQDAAESSTLAVAAGQWLRALRGEPARAWRGADGGLIAGFARPPGATGAPLRGDDFARILSARLLAPLVAAAGAATRWTVALDDALVGLPLEALPWPGATVAQPAASARAASAAGAAPTPAVTRLTLSYTPSASNWLAAPPRDAPRGPPGGLLALGAVDYETTAWPASGPFAGLTWPALPGAAREVERVAAQFPPRAAELLRGPQASADALLARARDGRLARVRYLHLAAHGHVPPHAPERSAIVLARRDADSPTDGYLTAAQIAGLPLRAELVTLSACDSGVGRHEAGQGLLGLAFAVLAAGGRAALLSLWPVADDTTAEFMAHFYARLRQGQAAADALARTKRAFAASTDSRRRDPRAWAAFVLYGR